MARVEQVRCAQGCFGFVEMAVELCGLGCDDVGDDGKWDEAEMVGVDVMCEMVFRVFVEVLLLLLVPAANCVFFAALRQTKRQFLLKKVIQS